MMDRTELAIRCRDDSAEGRVEREIEDLLRRLRNEIENVERFRDEFPGNWLGRRDSDFTPCESWASLTANAWSSLAHAYEDVGGTVAVWWGYHQAATWHTEKEA